MAQFNIPAIGRFSSQMLTYLGTQRTIRVVNGVAENTFKYQTGPTTFPGIDSVSVDALENGVVGNYSPEAYNFTKGYFQSRGASKVYADTMTGLSIDIAAILGVSTQTLLENMDPKKMLLSDDAYRVFNLLRDPGNQVGTVTSVDNRYSLQARAIRS